LLAQVLQNVCFFAGIIRLLVLVRVVLRLYGLRFFRRHRIGWYIIFRRLRRSTGLRLPTQGGSHSRLDTWLRSCRDTSVVVRH
jgi:hypothetical protein